MDLALIQATDDVIFFVYTHTEVVSLHKFYLIYMYLDNKSSGGTELLEGYIYIRQCKYIKTFLLFLQNQMFYPPVQSHVVTKSLYVGRTMCIIYPYLKANGEIFFDILWTQGVKKKNIHIECPNVTLKIEPRWAKVYMSEIVVTISECESHSYS